MLICIVCNILGLRAYTTLARGHARAMAIDDIELAWIRGEYS